MNIGSHIVEQERQEAVDRAMARYRARQAREQHRINTRGNAGLGHGARRLSREEAAALIARTTPVAH